MVALSLSFLIFEVALKKVSSRTVLIHSRVGLVFSRFRLPTECCNVVTIVCTGNFTLVCTGNFIINNTEVTGDEDMKDTVQVTSYY